MRHLLVVLGIAFCAVSLKSSAQSETRLPDANVLLTSNGAVDHYIKQTAKPSKKLRIEGNVDADHLHLLFNYLEKNGVTDSLFLDGLHVQKMPTSISRVAVSHISIARCDSLDLNDACLKLAANEKLSSVSFTVAYLPSFPLAIKQLKHLEKIKLVNTDLSLADGYALNYNLPGALYNEQVTDFGFTNPQLGASQLTLVYGSYDAGFSKQHIQQLSDYLQGVQGTSPQLAQRKPRNSFIYRHPLIKKPIAGCDVASNFYTFRAEDGLSFTYPSGSRIFIPKNAFVDAIGHLIRGDVTVSYREFRDATDIIVSGIPMKYDSAGQTVDFESAGMFEIAASAGSEQVFVAPDKTIDLQFSVTQPESSYNFYRLDEQQGWQYKGKPGPAFVVNSGGSVQRAENNGSSTAIEKYLSLVRGKFVPGPPDTTHFQERFESMRYLNNVYIGDVDEQSIANRKARNLKVKRVPGAKNYTCIEVLSTHRIRFPELRSYQSIVWMMDEKLTTAEFRKRFGRKIIFNDIQIINQQGRYILKLKSQYGFTEIPVTAFERKNGRLKKASMATMTLKDYQYNTIRGVREKRFDTKLKGEVKKYSTVLKRFGIIQLRSWKSVKPQMTETEKALSFEEWKAMILEYENTQSLRQFQYGISNTEGAAAVTRALKLNGTGIYNCDQAATVVNPAKILAAGKTILGKVFPAVMAYVISKGKNAALSFGAIDPNKGIMLNFSQTDSSKIVLIDALGRVAVIESHELQSYETYTHEGRYEFTVKEMGESPPLVELRSMLRW